MESDAVTLYIYATKWTTIINQMKNIKNIDS